MKVAEVKHKRQCRMGSTIVQNICTVHLKKFPNTYDFIRCVFLKFNIFVPIIFEIMSLVLSCLFCFYVLDNSCGIIFH